MNLHSTGHYRMTYNLHCRPCRLLYSQILQRPMRWQFFCVGTQRAKSRCLVRFAHLLWSGIERDSTPTINHGHCRSSQARSCPRATHLETLWGAELSICWRALAFSALLVSLSGLGEEYSGSRQGRSAIWAIAAKLTLSVPFTRDTVRLSGYGGCLGG